MGGPNCKALAIFQMSALYVQCVFHLLTEDQSSMCHDVLNDGFCEWEWLISKVNSDSQQGLFGMAVDQARNKFGDRLICDLQGYLPK